MTFGSMCNSYKTEIKEALNGMLVKDWEDGEPVTWNGTKEECQKVILKIFDKVVYQGLEGMKSGRVLGRMYREDMGKEPDLGKYIRISMEEGRKYNDYEYEPEEEWDPSDALDYDALIHEEEADDGRDTTQE